MDNEFSCRFNDYTQQMEKVLNGKIEEIEGADVLLKQAMKYSICAGGKRIRPVLFFAVAEMYKCKHSLFEPFACALELIHTYSLIHDDLPSMDNDDMRRGLPTNHKVYGEAMAILTGDALLNLAYETMLEAIAQEESDSLRILGISASNVIAAAAGAKGMVSGQVQDMDKNTSSHDIMRLRRVHSLKTGALIRASVISSAILCRASKAEIALLERYAENIGLAFQIRDDLLDIEGNDAELGKLTGSDAKNNKATYVSLLGPIGAGRALSESESQALSALELFGAKAGFLAEIAHYITTRTK